MENLQIQIQKWYNDGFDYFEGVAIMQRISKNKTLINTISRNEKPRFLEKMKYEIAKVKADGVVEVPILENQADDKSQNQEDNQWQTFPKDVQNAIKEKGTLYGNRDKLHRKLKKLPSDNEKPTMKKRALIVAEMDAMTQKMEFLRETIKAFEDDKSLTKFQNKMAKERASKGERKLDDMKDIELVKARNNARAYITNRTKRIKNMPDGPKKQKFELKLKDKKAVLLEIEILIKKREK